MGNRSPSYYRRLGRRDFHPYADPMDFQPFKIDSWNYKYHLDDYLDGWNEAEQKYNNEMETEHEKTCPLCGRQYEEE